MLVALCLLRLAVIRPHLQAYLCLAKARVEQLRREAGRIEACEIQRRVWVLVWEGTWDVGQAFHTLQAWGQLELRRSTATANCSPGGTGLLLPDGSEPAVPDATHPYPQLHASAQDAG